MEEPKHKKKNELWIVEAGIYDDHYILGTFDRRPDAVKARDKHNAQPGLAYDMVARIDTVRHNQTD